MVSSLIVPTILISGSLHFADVAENSTAQDVIDALLKVDEVRSEILGDLEDQGWALQKMRVERNGRPWEEEELEALGDGKPQLFLFNGLELTRIFWFTRHHRADIPCSPFA